MNDYDSIVSIYAFFFSAGIVAVDVVADYCDVASDHVFFRFSAMIARICLGRQRFIVV